MNRRTLTIFALITALVGGALVAVLAAGSPSSSTPSTAAPTTQTPTGDSSSTSSLPQDSTSVPGSDAVSGVTGSPLTVVPDNAPQFAEVSVSGVPLPSMPSEPVADPAIGMAAPGLSGVSFDGSKVSYTPGSRPTLLVFFAHWCSHCNNELPRLRAWFDSGRAPEGLDVIGISSVADKTRPNFPPSKWAISTMRWPWPVLVDSERYDALATYGANSFPAMVLVDANGKIVERRSGELDTKVFDAWVRDSLGL
jgi:thiol-disulfide isomerase/thioredoxin